MKDRKIILYIVIIIFIASLGTLTYRVGSSIKAKKDAIKEEYNKKQKDNDIMDDIVVFSLSSLYR